jgi:hypothetical protein
MNNKINFRLDKISMIKFESFIYTQERERIKKKRKLGEPADLLVRSSHFFKNIYARVLPLIIIFFIYYRQ